MSGGRRFARLAGLVLVQTTAVFVLLELAVRLLDPFGVSYYPETARYFDTVIVDEPWGYRNRPGLRGRFFGTPVEINRLGMRDREVGAKSPGEFRIIVSGDSVPFGMGVPYEDSYPHQLERLLAARHPGRHFRTLNMGTPSYNTEQELQQLESLGLGLQPDLMTLLFSGNDIEPKMWVIDKRKRWLANVAQRSYALSLGYRAWRRVRAWWVGRGLAPGDPEHARRIATIQLDQYRSDRPRWQAIDRSLTRIHALLRARGVPFVLFTHGELPFIASLLDGVAWREGFHIVHLRPLEDPRWAGVDPARSIVSPINGHPSAFGNQILATLMAEHLEHLGVIESRPEPMRTSQ